MIRRPPRSTRKESSAASDVYKRQVLRGVVYMTKSSGPRTEPWGTPQENVYQAVSYTHLRAHETRHDLVCRLLLETSASYLMNTSLFLTRSHLSPNLAITISVSFAVSVHTSIPKQPPPSPLPLFTPSSTNATLFITTCPSVRSLGFNGSRTLFIFGHTRSPIHITFSGVNASSRLGGRAL